MKRILSVIIALAVGFCGGFIYAKVGHKDKGTYDLQILSEQVRQISELATYQETYSIEVPYTSEAKKMFKKFTIPFSQKSAVVDFGGTIKMGPNLESFSRADVAISNDNKIITVTIPKSEILSHEINEKSWKLVDKKHGLFNLLKIDDADGIRKYAKNQVLKQLDIDSMLIHADENAKEQITKFLKTAYPGIDVVIESR